MAKKVSSAAKVNRVKTASDATRDRSVDLIRTRAYQIWESRGRIQGNDLENWLEAEKAVKE